MHGEGRHPFQFGRFSRAAGALVLVGAAACGSAEIVDTAEAPAPSVSVAFAEVEEVAAVPEVSLPEASAAETSAPSTSEPTPTVVGVEGTESAPEESVSTTSLPEVSAPTTTVPTASVPTTSLPEVSAPATTVPAATVPATTVPTTSVPATTVPATTVPAATVPATTVPTTSVPSVSLPVAPERDGGYDRDDWGPHNSGLCRGAVGSPDPYTGTPIDTCNVDHVVALHEAHESGGWAWPADQKQRFSQDPANHAASRACVNQSKGGDDIFEWSDSDIARSSACGGGYTVTSAGRCFLARTTVAVKSEWRLAVDQAEADALSRTLSGCGNQVPEFSQPPTTTTTSPPTTTVAPPDVCVIGGRTAAEYDAVSGIGEVLSARLVHAQPFSSRAALEAVRGIGPVKAEAVWSHFCGP